MTITEAVRWRAGGWRCLVCHGTSDNPGKHDAEVCEALWEPVKSRAIEGSFAGKAFDQGGLLER